MLLERQILARTRWLRRRRTLDCARRLLVAWTGLVRWKAWAQAAAQRHCKQRHCKGRRPHCLASVLLRFVLHLLRGVGSHLASTAAGRMRQRCLRCSHKRFLLRWHQWTGNLHRLQSAASKVKTKRGYLISGATVAAWQQYLLAFRTGYKRAQALRHRRQLRQSRSWLAVWWRGFVRRRTLAPLIAARVRRGHGHMLLQAFVTWYEPQAKQRLKAAYFTPWRALTARIAKLKFDVAFTLPDVRADAEGALAALQARELDVAVQRALDTGLAVMLPPPPPIPVSVINSDFASRAGSHSPTYEPQPRRMSAARTLHFQPVSRSTPPLTPNSQADAPPPPTSRDHVSQTSVSRGRYIRAGSEAKRERGEANRGGPLSSLSASRAVSSGPVGGAGFVAGYMKERELDLKERELALKERCV
jgi:hypothetical protein